MESCALKGPYFTIPVAPWHKQFVYLKREGKFYQFCCLPNGLSPAPRIFSKILKLFSLSSEVLTINQVLIQMLYGCTDKL